MRAHALLPAVVLLLVALLDTPPAGSVALVRCDGRVATIVGTDGPDRLEGTRGGDVIAALEGGDVVRGRGGDDVICGGGGTDRIAGGGGDDRLFGQLDGRFPDSHCASGTYVPGDLIEPGAGDDYVDAGYDPAQEGPCGGEPDSVVFASAHGGIRAGLGDPGREGRVRGQGRDVVLGQRRLAIVGTRFADRVVGGSGSDFIQGHEGRDHLAGGPGDDVLEDGDQGRRPASGDRLDGGDGDDVVTSDHGQDLVVSGGGDDQLRAGVDCPRVDGGPGVDRLMLGGHELVPGQAEQIVVDAAAGRVAVLPAEPFCGSLVALERYDLNASGAPVEIHGTDGPDDVTAFGSAGLTAYLHDGDDRLVGTDADDVVDAGGGEDTVDGGLGLDACLQTEVAVRCEYSSWPPPPPSCDGRPVTILAPPTGGDVLGTPGDDVILGSDVSDSIDGLAGDDVICARAGADTVTGGTGNDRLFGGDDLSEGDNYLRGDVMVPGPGDDLVDAGLDPRRILPDWVAGSRPDVIDYSTSTVGIVADLSPVGGVFTVAGEGTDTVVVPAVSSPALLEVRGSPFADRVTGGPGDDKITGMAGDDTIDGAAGDDRLYGENDCVEAPCGFGPLDHDTILGGPGADELTGSRGRDDLDGGDGNDVLSSTNLRGPGSLLGGPGDDRVVVQVRRSMSAAIDGGTGADTLVVDAERPFPRGGRITVDARRGRLHTSDGAVTATLQGFESYLMLAFNGHPSWAAELWFVGSDAPEDLASYSAGKTPLHARMLGGDDVFRAGRSDDWVDGGEGVDTVWADGGTDRCLSVEHAHGCELTSSPAAPSP